MTDDRQYVFSGSETQQQCVDCGVKATRRIVYRDYSIGDLVCPTHADWRKDTLNVVHTSIPARVVIVQFDKGKAA